MKTILVPLTGAALAPQALPYARSLAGLWSAKIHLVKLIPEFDRYNLLGIDAQLGAEHAGRLDVQPRYEPPSWTLLRQDARDYLVAQASRLRNAGVTVDIEVRLGTPAISIVEAAHECQAAMIMPATHGYNGLTRCVLGSVADTVLHATRTPLLLVRASC